MAERIHKRPNDEPEDAAPSQAHQPNTSQAQPQSQQPNLATRIASSTRSLAQSLAAPPSAPTSSLLADKSSSSAYAPQQAHPSSSSSSSHPIWHDRLTQIPSSSSTSTFRSRPAQYQSTADKSDFDIPDAATLPRAEEPDWAAAFHSNAPFLDIDAKGKGRISVASSQNENNTSNSNFTSDLTDEFHARWQTLEDEKRTDTVRSTINEDEVEKTRREAETWIAQFHEAPLDEHAYYRGVVDTSSRKSWKEQFGGAGEVEDGEEVRRLLEGILELDTEPETNANVESNAREAGEATRGEREAGQVGKGKEREVDAADLFGSEAAGLEGSRNSGPSALRPDFQALDPRNGAEESRMDHVLSRTAIMNEWEGMSGSKYMGEVWGDGQIDTDVGKKEDRVEVPLAEEEGRDKALRRLRGVAGMVGSDE